MRAQHDQNLNPGSFNLEPGGQLVELFRYFSPTCNILEIQGAGVTNGAVSQPLTSSVYKLCVLQTVY